MTNVVEEEEYIMDMDDDEEDDYQPSEPSEFMPADTLDGLVVQISDYAVSNNINPVQLRQRLFEEQLRPLASNHGYENLILSSAPEDEGYNALLTALYPALAPHLSRAINQQNRPTLIDLLGRALAKLMESQEVVEPVEAEEEEEYDVDPMEVKSIVNDIMNVYDKLYAPGFVNRPQGILTSDGVITMTSDGKKKVVKSGQSYAKGIYAGLVNFTGGYLPTQTSDDLINSNFLTATGQLTEVYSPMYHLRNIYGVRADGTIATKWMEFRGYLHKDVTKKVTAVLGKVTGDTLHVQKALKELFTNCIIIDELDRVMSLQLRVRIEGMKKGFGTFLLQNSSTIFATDTGLLINEQEDTVKVRNILYVFDEKAYKNEILFSYKAQEKLIASGVKPSASNVVLGRGLNGVDVTENFNDAGNVVTGIIAGSRSGKGVVTLSILASLYADNSPVFYLDYKPDMAATLWDFEREFNAKGIDAPIFSIDSLANQRSEGNNLVRPVRQFPYALNAPEDVRLDTSDHALMPYLKTMQLAALLADLRAKGSLPKNDKMFFVLDEAQKANSKYAIALKKMLDEEKANKPKGGEAPNDAYLYATKYIEVFQHDLKDKITGLMNTTGGTGLVGLIVLGQKADPVEWRLGEIGDWRKGVFGNIVANMNIKLLGRESGNSAMYGLPKSRYSGREFADQRGYFVKYRGSTTPEDPQAVEMIKTYLVLNKNDFDADAYASGNVDKSSFTGGLLTNIVDDTTRNNVVMNDLLNEDGTVRESIGFGGLMKLIMGGTSDEELAAKMSSSHRIVTDVFNRMGLNQRYSCIEEYLYDCSYESIFSLSEMTDMFQNGGLVDDSSDPSEQAWFDPSTDAQVPPIFVNGVEADTAVPLSDMAAEDSDLYNAEEEGFDYMPDETSLADDGFPDTDYSEPELPVDEIEPVIPEPLPSRVGRNNSASVEPPVETAPTASPNSQMHYDNVYNPKVELPQNPFKTFGASENPMSALNAIKFTSNFLMQEIQKLVGDFNRVHSFEVTGTGLVINNIAFRPQFSKEVIDSMPFDIRNQAVRGNMVELFHFGNLAKFRNLEVLRIDNGRLAEGRVRREIGLSPKKTWFKLFSRFRNLQELYINGALIQDEDTAQGYDDDGRGGYTLTERLREKLQMPVSAVSNSRMERVWNSTPVKVMGGAVGMTLGVKAVAVAASLFGGWGLLFGAFAGAAAIKEYRKRN